MIAAAILGAGASAFAVNILGFGISLALSSLFAPDEPDPQAPAKAEGVQARISSNPRNKLPVIYGKARVAGQTVFADISNDNQTMAFIVALSEGELEKITDIYWEDKKLTMTPSGTLTSPSGAVDEDGKNHDFLNTTLKISVHPAGGRCSAMESFSTRWSNSASSRTMPDVAYAYIELTYDRELNVTGLPSRLYFLCNGRTVDQLNTTSKAMEVSTVTSTNPVDCLIDYLTDTKYGASIPISNIDLDSMALHKTFCNVNKNHTESYCSFPSGDTLNTVLLVGSNYGNEVSCTNVISDQNNHGTWNTGGTTLSGKRYETNGVLSTNEDIDKNISHLTVGNGAAFSYNLGKFGVVSEGVTATAQRSGTDVSFSEDNIIGRLTLSSAGFDEKINELTVKFDSIAQKYQEEQAILKIPTGSAIRNANEPRLERTLRFNMVNNNVQAVRAATILLNQSRQNLRVSFETDLSSSDLQAGDVVKITHATPGWSNKLFKIQQVTEKSVKVDGEQILGIMIICKEYAATDYADSVIQLTDLAPNTKFLDPYAMTDMNLVATDTSSTDAGAVRNAINLAWTESVYQARVEIRYAERVLATSLVATNVYTILTLGTTSQAQWNTAAGTSGVTYASGSTFTASAVGVGTGVTTLPYKYLTTSGDSAVLLDLKPVTGYEIAIRMISSVGVVGTYELFDSNGAVAGGVSYFTTDTISAITPVKVEVEVSSGNGSGFTTADSSDKTLKANVYQGSTEVLDSVSAHNGYHYRWYSNGQTICIDSSGNQVGLATANIHTSQLACESAGGYWLSSGAAGTKCRVSSVDQTTSMDDLSGDILGCTVALSSRADTNVKRTANTHVLRTIIVGDEDVTNSADIKCTVSNIP